MSDEINLSEVIRGVTRKQRKEELQVTYFLNELAGKEITIVDVDPVNSIIVIEEDGQKKRVFTNSKVVLKKLLPLKEYIKNTNNKVKAKVVQKISRNNRTYVDIL